MGSGTGSCLVRQRRGPLGYSQPAVPCLPSWNLPSWDLPHLGPTSPGTCPPGACLTWDLPSRDLPFQGRLYLGQQNSPCLSLLFPSPQPWLCVCCPCSLLTLPWSPRQVLSPGTSFHQREKSPWHKTSEATHCVGSRPTPTYNPATPCTQGHGLCT